jgi:hypothetical protein
MATSGPFASRQKSRSDPFPAHCSGAHFGQAADTIAASAYPFNREGRAEVGAFSAQNSERSIRYKARADFPRCPGRPHDVRLSWPFDASPDELRKPLSAMSECPVGHTIADTVPNPPILSDRVDIVLSYAYPFGRNPIGHSE